MATDLYSSRRLIALTLSKSLVKLFDYILDGPGHEKNPTWNMLQQIWAAAAGARLSTHVETNTYTQ